ncbi:MAG: DUF2892 domain-containing protein [Thermoanaerobaculales bacterium]|jgi:K+-transporting ATPase A subunit|nr:DUF2892 domain-containing protein [Thermoanaerobaculales bacterium]
MKRNVGSVDRIIRIALGLAIGGTGLALHSWLGLIGLVPIATALIGRCPAYLPFGISTCNLPAEGS